VPEGGGMQAARHTRHARHCPLVGWLTILVSTLALFCYTTSAVLFSEQTVFSSHSISA